MTRIARMTLAKFDRFRRLLDAFFKTKSNNIHKTNNRKRNRETKDAHSRARKETQESNQRIITLEFAFFRSFFALKFELNKRIEKKKSWENTWNICSNVYHSQLYDSLFSFYFIIKLSFHIDFALQQSHLDHHVQSKATNMFFVNSINSRIDSFEESFVLIEAHMTSECLSRVQKSYFLELFWQTYHCTFSIVNELQFKEHYKSLWVTNLSNESSRQSSSLVEIVFVLCMQYDIAFVFRSDVNQVYKTNVDNKNSNIAKRRFYHKCQTLLSYEAKSSLIFILQCHIFFVIYLRNASFLNMTYNTLIVTIRIACLLELNQESTNTLFKAQQKLRRRLW